MGQPIVVVQKPSSTEGVLRFEINRSLTGMGHELARRLFEHGGVKAVHVFSNMITVELAAGETGQGMRELVEELFIHYREGVQPSIP